MRARDLLRTRIDAKRSAQNLVLLENMDRRAGLQLRLQEMVEGLSTVAISYYPVSLLGHLLFPLGDPMAVRKGVLTAIVALPVVLTVRWLVRRV